MSYSSHGRYRSRLFNFVNRQSRRLLEQGGRAIRNLQVAATWGAQIFLYPIYLLTQTGLSARHQVRGEAKSTSPTLNSAQESSPSQPEINVPAADTPIQAILKEVTILPLSELGGSFEEINLTPQPPSLQEKMEKEREDGGKEVIENNRLSWTENIYQSSLRGIKLLSSSFNQLRDGRLTEDVKANKITAQHHNFRSPGFLLFVRGDESISQSEVKGGLIQDSQKLTNNTIPNLDLQSWVIQGVATLLETRSLVLVTVENEILDILTPEQQQKLSARISWELANLFRQWQIAFKSQSPKVPRRLSSMAKPTLFLPVRMFWQLMGWVQTSPIAVTLNLFSESTLITTINSPNLIEPLEPVTAPLANTPSLIEPLEPVSAPLVKSLLAKILPDKALLLLESKGKGLDPDTLVAESQSLVQELKNAVLLRQQTQNHIQKLETQLITPQNSAAPTEKDNPHPFWLQDLIYRAIEYFFGRSSNLLETNSEEEGRANQLSTINYSSNIKSKLPTSEIKQDPWLTWDDLFGKSDKSDKNTTPSQPTHSILKGDISKTYANLPEGFNRNIATGINSAWGLIQGYLKPKGNITVIDNNTREENPETQTGLGGERVENHLQNMIGKLAVSVKEQFTVAAPGAIALNSSPLVSLSLGVTTDIPYPTKTPKPVKRRKNKKLAKTQNLIKVTEPGSNLDSSIIPQTVAKTQNQQLITNKQKLETKAQFTDIQPAPDWIETKAIPTGYVKHPLELVLEWLDMAIVWVEELFLKVLEWVQKLWHRL